MAINEMLFMEIRLLRLLCNKYNLSMKEAHELFVAGDIYTYFEECFDDYHTCGDNVAFKDIEEILHRKNALK